MSKQGRTGLAAAVYIILAGLQRGMPLIILPFVSQVMSPAEYGAASMLTASSLLLITIIAAPLESLVFRSAARGGDEAPALLRVAALYCYFIAPVMLGVVAAVVAATTDTFLGVSGDIWAIEILAVGFLPAMTYVALPVVQARQDLYRFTLLAATSILLMAITKCLFLLIWKLGVLGWVVSDLVAAVTSSLMALLLVRPPKAAVTPAHIRAVVTFAAPLIPHRTSFWAISSLSRPVMAMVSSLTQVGLISLGLNVASIASLLLTEINRALMPQYSRETFPAPTRNTINAVRLQIVLACTVPAFVGSLLALVGRWLFAEPYWPAFALTGVLLIGQAAYGIYFVPMNYLVQSAGITKPVALASGGGALFMLVGLVALGQRYGAVGAAYSTVFGFSIMAIIAASLVRRLNLDVIWSSWNRCWPEVALGAIALTLSVWALSVPTGSGRAHLLASIGLVAAAIAIVVTSRRRPLGG